MKRALKENILKRQNGKSAIEQIPLPTDLELWDTDRIVPKAKGGIYTTENTRALDPQEHMRRHGNFRERAVELDELKNLIDAREQVRKLLNSTNNRITAMKRRTDQLDIGTVEWLEVQIDETTKQLKLIDKKITKHLKGMHDPIVKIALDVKGVGPITVAYMMTYIDIEKARHASSMWAYCGYDKASHERYTKGVAGGGNKTLRTVLYTMADSMIKTRSPYRDVYDNTKNRLSVSKKITKSRNTQGKLIECAWMETKPSHRHGAAMRAMIKHFLADWWYVHRTINELTTRPLYVEEYLGHTGIIKPEERGWKY